MANRTTHCPRLNLLSLLALALLVAGCATTQNPSGSGHIRNQTLTNNAANRSFTSSPLHRFFERWKGTPYRYGGETHNGVDCSSFVRQAIDATESFELPRTTVAQSRVGSPVSRSSLERGDLVFFKTGRGSHHVGIYLGNGRFMHVSSKIGVTISRLSNVYWRRHYWQARRLNVASNTL